MAESTLPTPTAEDRAEARFFTASGGKPPTDEQKTEVATLRTLIVALGVEIERNVPNGRNKSLALTALEDVQMRANRAIFDPGAVWPAESSIVDAPRPASASPTPVKGRIVHYCLSEHDADAINRRRRDAVDYRKNPYNDPRVAKKPTGFVVHCGNDVSAGDYVPLVITRTHSARGVISGQAILDGNDTLWAPSIAEGSEPGTWTWPPRV